jgi:galactokinase
MMGGGFGGCTINLIGKDGTDKFIRSVEEEYPRRTGINPEIYRVAIGDGAGRIL